MSETPKAGPSPLTNAFKSATLITKSVTGF